MNPVRVGLCLNLGLVALVVASMVVSETQHGLVWVNSSVLRLAIASMVVMMHAVTTIHKSWDSILHRWNVLIAGVLFPVLLDELHALHDSVYAARRTESGFFEAIPFVVLFTSLLYETPATEARYLKTAKYARMALFVLNLILTVYYTGLRSKSMVTMLGFFAYQVPLGILREMCSLSSFETLLLSMLSGFAINYLYLYRISPVSVESDFSVGLATNVVIIASITALGATMLVSVFNCKTIGVLAKTNMSTCLVVVCTTILLQTCVLFQESSLQVSGKTIRWLVDFIHAEDMGPLKMSGMWIGIIALFLFTADHVSGPKVRTLNAPQEFMTPEGKYVTRTEKFSMIDFEKPKMSKISSRKLFHGLMVAILTPPLYLWAHKPVLLAYSCLSLGGVLVIFLLMELIRARSTSLPVKQRSTFMVSMAIYFDRFAGPKRRWGNEIVIRGRDYDGAVDEVQRLESSPGWRKWHCTTDHFSLLLGCAIPTWYYASMATGFRSVLLPLMGCITVGLGDSASAIVGSNYGKTKWSPSHSGRTLEGSLAALCVCALVVLAPFAMQLTSPSSPTAPPPTDNPRAAVAAVALSTAVEAFASVNDNLLVAVYSSVAYAALVRLM